MDNNNLIEQLLNYISPEESQRIENRMLVAAKIDDALKANGWKKKDLMEAMGKRNQSEITKWLSGTHNFTIDTLTDLSRVLGVNFLNIDKPCPIIEKQYKIATVYVKINSERPNFINDMLVAQTIKGDTLSSVNCYFTNN